jgi:hypothetical protein
MARARNIKPGIMLNDELAAREHWQRLLFIYLWMLADRAGRLVDNPRRIRAMAFPYEPELPMDEGLQTLHDAGFIRRYEVGGQRLIQIVNFGKHQNPHKNEAPSVLPPPEAAPDKHGTSTVQVPEEHGVCMALVPDKHGTTRADSLIPDSPIPDPPLSDSGWTSASGLQEFIDAYPKKTKRDATARAYISTIETSQEHDRLMAGLHRWMESDQWTRSLKSDGGRFIPDPDRFVSERRYLDEPALKQAEGAGANDIIGEALKRMRHGAEVAA